MPTGTVLGHVHLNVADIPATEAFYAGALGFDVTTRTYPGALFLSAGGYHHHIGSNTWEGPGAPPPPAGRARARRLRGRAAGRRGARAGARARRERGPCDARGRGRRADRRPFEESSHSSRRSLVAEHGCPTPPTQTPGSDRAEAVGAIIRRRRQALGLTLRAFARQCDISPAHLSKVERGLASPSLAMLTRIVQELDLHGADLFGLAAGGGARHARRPRRRRAARGARRREPRRRASCGSRRRRASPPSCSARAGRGTSCRRARRTAR